MRLARLERWSEFRRSIISARTLVSCLDRDSLDSSDVNLASANNLEALSGSDQIQSAVGCFN